MAYIQLITIKTVKNQKSHLNHSQRQSRHTAMLQQNPKPYYNFNQVAMVESQYESKRRNVGNFNVMIGNGIPNAGGPNAAISLATTNAMIGMPSNNKSPIRERQYDRENNNSINTPSRIGQQGNTKVSLSPIRSRRQADPTSSTTSIPSSSTSIRSTAYSRRKFTQPQDYQNFCLTHTNKVAKFTLSRQGQQLFFCQRCAIPLISQGFKLTKITQDQPQQSPRIKQISEFLSQLSSLESCLHSKKSSLSSTLSSFSSQLASQLSSLSQFYSQFFQILTQHKNRVTQELQSQYKKVTLPYTLQLERLQNAIKDAKNMKEDIECSIKTVIMEAGESDYRAVMGQYYGNLGEFKEICDRQAKRGDEGLAMRKLVFRAGEEVCRGLVDGLVIQWDDQGEEESDGENVKIVFENGQIRKDQESDRQNPIECLQSEDDNRNLSQNGNSCSKYGQNGTNMSGMGFNLNLNLNSAKNKDMGGLFCSFDE